MSLKATLEKQKNQKQIEKGLYKMFQDLIEGKIVMLKGDPGYTPVLGKDFLTETDIASIVAMILERATPIKGKHYNDGEDGRDGAPGPAGQNGTHGKNGRDGRNGRDAMVDIQAIVKQVLAELDLQIKKISIKDIDGLASELINAKQVRHGGGQGKTYLPLLGTDVKTADNTTYTFTNPPLTSELEVYRGGALQFVANADYTITAAPGGRAKAVVLSVPLNVAAGETINFRHKG